MMRLLVTMAVFLGLVGPALAAGAHRCPPNKARQAEVEAAGARNWRELFDAYSHFSACDEAAIAEGFSDSVMRLLSGDGSTWSDLAALVRKDAAFLVFVLRHLDDTVPSATLDAVERAASKQCVTSATAVCQAVLDAATRLRSRVAASAGAPKGAPIPELASKEVVELLAEIDLVRDYGRADKFGLRIFRHRPAGECPGGANSCARERLLFLASPYDQYPDARVFRLDLQSAFDRVSVIAKPKDEKDAFTVAVYALSNEGGVSCATYTISLMQMRPAGAPCR